MVILMSISSKLWDCFDKKFIELMNDLFFITMSLLCLIYVNILSSFSTNDDTMSLSSGILISSLKFSINDIYSYVSYTLPLTPKKSIFKAATSTFSEYVLTPVGRKNTYFPGLLYSIYTYVWESNSTNATGYQNSLCPICLDVLDLFFSNHCS